MGALHRGHYSLLARARRECATVVASIYVNPLQFGPQEDFNRYPRTLSEDVQLCEEAGVDYVFAPRQLTEQGCTLVVPPPALTNTLCGLHRPGHFVGVATVVLQLLHLVQPQRTYLGEKDAQQLAVIQKLTRDLYLPVGIIPCRTIRELDGLALSSRNRYLSAEERQEAPRIYKALLEAQAAFLAGQTDAQALQALITQQLGSLLTLDYVALVHPLTLQPVHAVIDPTLLAVAVRLGSTRLIDNIRLTHQKAPIIAIDGPAGSGKSTVAVQVARKLGFVHLDTGAMYRAVTWAALSRRIALTPLELTRLAHQLDLRLQTVPDALAGRPATRIWVEDTEVTDLIRTPLVNAQVSTVAAVEGVRQVLVQKQQMLGRKGGVVMEGRDIGTQVFPQADLKIFLTASPEVRAQRRQKDLTRPGTPPPALASLTLQIQQRDLQDSTRSASPLIQAPDALLLNTDALSVEEVTECICTWARYL